MKPTLQILRHGRRGVFLAGLLLLKSAAMLTCDAAPDRPVPQEDGVWREDLWNGERAYRAASNGFVAIVSIERCRLVHFGPTTTGRNLLFSPQTRNDATRVWGGHRVWLGPQSDWAGGWPPPAGWEAAAASSVVAHEGHLELIVADAGDGWPSFSRSYAWKDGGLVCGVHAHGGTRDAQVVQILQIPTDAVVDVRAFPEADSPNGFALQGLGRGLVRDFSWPAQVSRGGGDALTVHFNGHREKLAFRPQVLVAHVEGCTITMSRHVLDGEIANEPDAGHFTQIYTGPEEGDRVIEIEQLSPGLKAPAGGTFSVLVTGRIDPQD